MSDDSCCRGATMVELFLNGLSYSEVAHHMGVSRNVVSGMMKRRGIKANMRPAQAQARAAQRQSEILAGRARDQWARRRSNPEVLRGGEALAP